MTYLLPVGVAIVLWWLSTVVLLWRLRLPRKTFPVTLLLVSVLGIGGGVAFYLSLEMATTPGAYLAFVAALAIWCWHEAVYFLGYLTGPRPQACPENCSTWSRFCYGVQASLYHELAVIATALLLIAASSGAVNSVAMQSFVVLWLMRWSTKMNIFFGVSNLHQDFWPARLRYLGSYVTIARGNLFFPVSIALAVVLSAWVGAPLWSAVPGDFGTAGAVLVLTLLALACLEHVFLMIPVPDQWLWKLGVGSADSEERVSARAERVTTPHLSAVPVHGKPAAR